MFVEMKNISSEESYQAFKDRYANRRTSVDFWHYSDQLYQWYRQNQARAFGLLDFNRLENR